MDLQKLLITTGIILAVLVAIILGSSLLNAGKNQATFPERGKYIYDEADRLGTEPELMISSYLLGIDRRTGYELVLVFPKDKLEEKEIINWFNQHGVGKKGKDNGAALFVFPDNSWFMSIGAGNDKVSVPYSKTCGDRILGKGLNEDFALSVLRYVDTIGKKIDEPTPVEVAGNFSKTIASNLDVIMLWGLFIALIVFLYKQKDGFQSDDLMIPIALFLALGIFFGLNAVMVVASNGGPSTGYTDYGVINSSKLDSRDYVTIVCVSNGESTSCYPVPHTEYTNDVTIISYDLKTYGYRFTTTDYKGAWYHVKGEFDRLTISASDSSLRDVYGFNDNSGGKTIGDGAWG